MTPRQRDCLEAIRKLTVDGVSPTMSELAAKLGVASKSNIAGLVEHLERQGLIVRDRYRERSIRIVGETSAYTREALERLPTSDLEALSGRVETILFYREHEAA